MDVKYINPFLEAGKSVLKSAANLDISPGKIYLKSSPYSSDSVLIVIGIMGTLKGQIIFSMSKSAACTIASGMMMGSPVPSLNEVAKSAISEAANMILGNAATIFYNNNIKIDITPPSLLMGDNLQISTPKAQTICIPLLLDNNEFISVDIILLE